MWTAQCVTLDFVIILTTLLYSSNFGKGETHNMEKCDIRMWHLELMEQILIHSENTMTPRQSAILKKVDRLVEMATDENALMPCSLLKTYSSLILPGIDIPVSFTEEVPDDSWEENIQNVHMNLNSKVTNSIDTHENDAETSDIVINDLTTKPLDDSFDGDISYIKGMKPESVSIHEEEGVEVESGTVTENKLEENKIPLERNIENGDTTMQDFDNVDLETEEMSIYSADQIPPMDDSPQKSEKGHSTGHSTSEDRWFNDDFPVHGDVNDPKVAETEQGFKYHMETIHSMCDNERHRRKSCNLICAYLDILAHKCNKWEIQRYAKTTYHITTYSTVSSMCGNERYNRKSYNLICAYLDILAHKCNEWDIQRYVKTTYHNTINSINVLDCLTCKLKYPIKCALICHYVNIFNPNCGSISSNKNDSIFLRRRKNETSEIFSTDIAGRNNENKHHKLFHIKLMEHFFTTCAISRNLNTSKRAESNKLCHYMALIHPSSVTINSGIHNNSGTIVFENCIHSSPDTSHARMNPNERSSTDDHNIVYEQSDKLSVPESQLPVSNNQVDSSVTYNGNVQVPIADGMDSSSPAPTESVQVPTTLDSHEGSFDDIETDRAHDPKTNVVSLDISKQTNSHEILNSKKDELLNMKEEVTHDNDIDEKLELSTDLSDKGKQLKTDYSEVIKEQITGILEIQESQHNSKIQHLELMIVKLENKLLSKSMDEKDDTHSLQKLENHILKIENELIKLNQTHQELQKEHETLKSKQRKISSYELQANTTPRRSNYLALTDKSENEIMAQQKTKIRELSQHVRNQSLVVQELYSRYELLEEQNRQLFQTMVNQTALISHVVSQLNEINENNLKERLKTHELNLKLQLLQEQGIAREHIVEDGYDNKRHQRQDASDSLSKSSGIRKQKSMVETISHKNNSLFTRLMLILHPYTYLEPLLKIIKLQIHLNVPSPSICLYHEIIVSNIAPASHLTWLKCEAITDTLALKKINYVGTSPPTNHVDNDITLKKSIVGGVSTEGISIPENDNDKIRSSENEMPTEKALESVLITSDHTLESNRDPVMFAIEDDEDNRENTKDGDDKMPPKETSEEAVEETKTLPLERSVNEDVIFFPIEDDEGGDDVDNDILIDVYQSAVPSDDHVAIKVDDGKENTNDEMLSQAMNKIDDYKGSYEEIKDESKEVAFNQNGNNNLKGGNEMNSDENRNTYATLSENKDYDKEFHRKDQNNDDVGLEDTNRVYNDNEPTSDNDNKKMVQLEEVDHAYIFHDLDLENEKGNNKGDINDREHGDEKHYSINNKEEMVRNNGEHKAKGKKEINDDNMFRTEDDNYYEEKEEEEEEEEEKEEEEEEEGEEEENDDGVFPDDDENDQAHVIGRPKNDDKNNAKNQGRHSENREHHATQSEDDNNTDNRNYEKHNNEGNDSSNDDQKHHSGNKVDLEVNLDNKNIRVNTEKGDDNILDNTNVLFKKENADDAMVDHKNPQSQSGSLNDQDGSIKQENVEKSENLAQDSITNEIESLGDDGRERQSDHAKHSSLVDDTSRVDGSKEAPGSHSLEMPSINSDDDNDDLEENERNILSQPKGSLKDNTSNRMSSSNNETVPSLNRKSDGLQKSGLNKEERREVIHKDDALKEEKTSKQGAKQMKDALQRPDKSDEKPADCFDLYKQGETGDGLNRIFVRGLNSSVPVLCEANGSDRGWTVLLKREDGTEEFYRDFKDYKDGFGAPTGDHYLGNNVIHYLTNQKRYGLKVTLTNWEGETAFALYDHFRIDGEDNGFQLHLRGFSGTAGDGLGKHNGMRFSSRDVDNDLLKTEMGGSCAKRFKAAGWFYKCYMSNLMGVYYHTAVIPPKRFDGITWKPWLGPNYSMKKVVMSIRPLE